MEKRAGAGSPALSMPLAPVPVAAPLAPLGSAVPLPSPSQYPIVSLSSLGLAPCSWPHLQPWLRLWLPVVRSSGAASSKHGCGSAVDGTRGAIYSRVALGPGAGPRAWGDSAAPHEGPAKRRRMKCWVSAFLRVGSFGTAWFGS